MNRHLYFYLLLFICSPLKYLYAVDDIDLKILQVSNTKRILSVTELASEINDSRIVYLGEIHDKELHHRVQLEIIGELFRANPNIAIGMEMFPNESQDDLNLYLQGDMEEDEFLDNIDYRNGWGFDIALYRPILEFAKVHKLRVIALNINPQVIREVSDKGIADLNAKTLNMLPGSIDFSNVCYRDFLMDIYKKHPHTKSNKFNRFYEVQLIWDEYMAEKVDNFLINNRDTKLIVITGNGHLVYDYGIPSRVYRRNKVDYVTIVQDIEEDKQVSDFIVNTQGS